MTVDTCKGVEHQLQAYLDRSLTPDRGIYR